MCGCVVCIEFVFGCITAGHHVHASVLVPPACSPFRAPVTALNLEGYGLAFAAVCWYNYQKLIAMQTAKPTSAAEQEVGGCVGPGNAGCGSRGL